MQRRLHWKGGVLCDRVLCDCVMGGKKWMRLHFSSFLHCCSKPCSSSCRCTWLPSNIYGCFLWNIVTFHLTSGWCHLNDFLLPVWSSTPWTCTYALTFSTMCPGQAEVVSPRLAQGLRPLSAFYFVHQQTMCTTLESQYTGVRYMLKKGSVALRLAQGWKVLSMFFFVHKFHTKCDICKSCALVSCTMYNVATVDLHMLDLC